MRDCLERLGVICFLESGCDIANGWKGVIFGGQESFQRCVAGNACMARDLKFVRAHFWSGPGEIAEFLQEFGNCGVERIDNVKAAQTGQSENVIGGHGPDENGADKMEGSRIG